MATDAPFDQAGACICCAHEQASALGPCEACGEDRVLPSPFLLGAFGPSWRLAVRSAAKTQHPPESQR